jgi:HK97 gp10 family phage protein
MSSFSINIANLPNLKKQLDNIPKDIEKKVRLEMTAFGMDVVRDAKALAPVDEAHLKSSISYAFGVADKGLSVEIIVATDYAAYLEFGTRSFASNLVATLPPDWQSFAATFRGPGGGSFAELVERLTEWVRRKGIAAQMEYVRAKPKRLGRKKVQAGQDYAAAYMIALSILKKGIKAHPFLYPAVQYNKAILIDNLNALFK